MRLLLLLIIALVGLALGIRLLADWLRALGEKPEHPAEPLPYRRAEEFLSPAERTFYGALRNALGDRYCIFAKVRLADLVEVWADTPQPQTHLGKIAGQRLDFVLCDPRRLTPVLAIELEHSLPAPPERAQPDGFVDSVLEVAGLPLLRVPARGSYGVGELNALVASKIGS
jgi:hypothetical protein